MCLFEFYDPLFEELHGTDLNRRRVARSRPDTNARLRELQKIERAILAPLFRGSPGTARFVQFSIPTFTAMYMFLAKEKCEWPELQVTPHWEEQQRLRLALHCTIFDNVIRTELDTIFAEWKLWLFREDLLATAELSEVFKDELAVDICFTAAGGDPLAMLFRILADTRAATSLDRIRVEVI